MMQPKYKALMNEELKKASSMADIFRILGNYYDLEGCKPGYITKMTLIHALQKGVDIVKAEPKKAYQ